MNNAIFETPPTVKDIKKVASMIEDIRIAMMTTCDDAGNLRSRPMMTQHVDQTSNEIWFFASDESVKTGDVQKQGNMNLAYGCPEKNSFVSISGESFLSRDPAKIEQLWSPAVEAWFPQGKHDPKLCLIAVKIEHAEYWDAPSNRMVTLYGKAKAFVTGEARTQVGDHQNLDYRSR